MKPTNREELKQLSQYYQKLPVMIRPADKINDCLKIHYKTEYKVTNLKTFHEWKQEGKHIKKGETAFKIWSKPRNENGHTREERTDENEANIFDRWYITNLFDISQVN